MSGGMILWNILLSTGIIFSLFSVLFICYLINKKLEIKVEELQLQIQQIEKDTSSLFQQLEKEEVP